MLLCDFLKNFGHFRLTKAIVKNPIFGVKMSIKGFLSIFAYICKDREVNLHQVFHRPKYLR